MHAVRTSRNVLSIVLLAAACMAQLIPGAKAQTDALERVTNATNETSQLKKAGPPHDPTTLGIVTGDRNDTEFTAADEIAQLIATGQESGPHGEMALRVAPMVGDGGGLQNIRDVLTLADADMSIVPVAMLNRAPAALGLDDLRMHIVYIAPLYEEEFHIVAPLTIGNISDLAGKTVNLGMEDTAAAVLAAVLGGEVFERLGLKVNAVNFDQSRAMRAMRRGEIEADLLLSSKPVGSLASDIFLEDRLHFIEIPYLPALEKDFLPATLTHDDYPNLILPGQSIDTIGTRSVLIAYNWPKGSDRYRLLDSFVRTLFSRFSELQTGPHHPKWREVNLAATVPGWSRFPPAQRWLDQQEFESFLNKWGTGAEADRARLFHDFLRWREQSGGG
ncbi:MAG: TAXI family TRAP transporter solute-binding subunit [Methylocella sp.]